MALQSLAYVGVGSRDLAGWRQLGCTVVGLQCIDLTSTKISFRMDDRKQRIFIDGEVPEGETILGWEVAGPAELQRMAARLEQAQVRVHREPAHVADSRFVAELISFKDPIGNRHEIGWGLHKSAEVFQPGRAMSGFRTGALGLGHAVVTAPDIESLLPFYVDVLGFSVSDFVSTPFKAVFFHINRRHHSFALIEAASAGFHHLMLEMNSLDDVGQALDLAQSGDCVSVTLGRHTNDFMTSFYARTPSSLFIECGWGGREIDPATWQSFEVMDGPSLWGHERSWLPESDREEARRMRMNAAARGVRQPVQVMDGNYRRMSDICPWIGEQERNTTKKRTGYD
ncbi:MAG: VOC family protein [Sphingomonas sp.]|uniref:VOC family protein n=1 Tax=Sphingomonas sp. TaxID=28214 RepID=UPI002617EB7D|nr:VOC family protein [Sphingomonas sp.]MDK2766085.1 VOC family protein [Sphingomonas sp.]